MKNITIYLSSVNIWQDVLRFYYSLSENIHSKMPESVGEMEEFVYDYHDILQRKIDLFNGLDCVSINNKSFREILQFDNVSLWQFVVSEVYSDVYDNPFIIIHVISTIFETHKVKTAYFYGHFTGGDKELILKIADVAQVEAIFPSPHNENIVEKQVLRKNVKNILRSIGCYDIFSSIRFTIKRVQSIFCPARSVRENVCNFIAKLRKKSNVEVFHDNVLFISYPRSIRGGKDIYYDLFKDFFRKNNMQVLRIDVPYYFQIKGDIFTYIKKSVTSPLDGYNQLFFDEFYDSSAYAQSLKYRDHFEGIFTELESNESFQSALLYKGVSYFSAIRVNLKYLFVDYLVYCIEVLLTARNILSRLKPKAIFAAYEVGLYARALIIEAHRLGVQSVGLQHGLIYAKGHHYYAMSNLSNKPSFDTFCDKTILCSKTLLFSDHYADVLTKKYSYPEDSVHVFCDWKFSQEIADIQPSSIEIPSGKQKVIFLTSGLSNVLKNILSGLLDPEKHVLLLKFHPDFPYCEEYKEFFAKLLIEPIDLSHLSSYEAIGFADIVVCPSLSSVTIEALALNKKVFALKSAYVTCIWDDCVVDIEKVESFDDNVSYADDEVCSILRNFGYFPMTQEEKHEAITKLMADLLRDSSDKKNFQ